VNGTPPAGTTSFTYSVTAANTAGTATAGPYIVTIAPTTSKADVSAALTCPATMTIGRTGTCTLTVANNGPAAASKLTAGILLPPALSEMSCTPGCAEHDNLLTWTQDTLPAGGNATFTTTIKASAAGKALVLAAAASRNPDPSPLNNIGIQKISISR
jgi:uncharacterized repeat protein (TIGR01451 family)